MSTMTTSPNKKPEESSSPSSWPSSSHQMAAVDIQRRDTDNVAARVGVPVSIAEPTLVTYRSAGIGTFGVFMRFLGMPLEKIALYMNSSQVSGKGQFRQAIQLTFKEGMTAPYKVVGPASITAWFFQYSVMGFAFQFFDHGLSKLLGVDPVYYGPQLMAPPVRTNEEHHTSMDYQIKATLKTMASPIMAAALETYVSNRAEVQRYFGRKQFATIEQRSMMRMAATTTTFNNPLKRAAGPAFAPCMIRNLIMCQTSFIVTPITYKLYFPQEQKSKTSLFWYGLGLNIFVGNVVAITQQALWGRSLDYLASHGRIHYRSIIQESFQKEGSKAFFTGPKWFSRVLMNAPAQGVLPWFYNEVLPLGEDTVLTAMKTYVYDPFLHEMEFLSKEQARVVVVEGGSTSTSSLHLSTSIETTGCTSSQQN